MHTHRGERIANGRSAVKQLKAMTAERTTRPASRADNSANNEHAKLTLEEHRLRRRLIGALVATAAIVTLLLAVPPLRRVAKTIGQMSPGWLVLALVLELLSSFSFVVIFRLFFTLVPAGAARELAWTEMGSGALLPGGGVGAYAIGGWLLHRAGMSPRRIVERSSGLFFLTSAANAAALFLGGLVLAIGLGHGPHDFVRTVLPAIVAALGVALVLALPLLVSHGRITGGWVRDLLCGIRSAQRALGRPHWRLLGAVGYLAFDIAVLWVTFEATGHQLPVGALIVAYIVGYLANLIPVPGGVGVLEGGLAAMLILYGAPATQAAAAVLVYHAIAFWVPSLGGIAGYWRLRCRLRDSGKRSDRRKTVAEQPGPLALGKPCGWRGLNPFAR